MLFSIAFMANTSPVSRNSTKCTLHMFPRESLVTIGIQWKLAQDLKCRTVRTSFCHRALTQNLLANSVWTAVSENGQSQAYKWSLSCCIYQCLKNYDILRNITRYPCLFYFIVTFQYLHIQEVWLVENPSIPNFDRCSSPVGPTTKVICHNLWPFSQS
jgi:hypothetical protein